MSVGREIISFFFIIPEKVGTVLVGNKFLAKRVLNSNHMTIMLGILQGSFWPRLSTVLNANMIHLKKSAPKLATIFNIMQKDLIT